jgi:TolB-like protein
MMNFLRELKRRRVLHTAGLYVLGAWIVLQVAEVLAGAGLPPGTMRYLLVGLSFGFPLALIAGWFFDISKEGIRRTGPLAAGEQLPELTFLDHLLLIGLVAVVAFDVWILSYTPGEEPAAGAVVRSAQQRTVAVLAFEDMQAVDDESIGASLAEELRSSLTRTAGLRVLGPETSKALYLAGDDRIGMASELLVTALLLGEVLMDGGRLQISARLVGVPAGNEIWSTRVESAVGDGVRLGNDLVEQVVRAVAPSLDPDPVQGQRAEAGDCRSVYDVYLRGKQLSKARRVTQAERYQRGMQLLREAVRKDDQCALAWEAIAVGELDWNVPGFARAGAAARRALELNEALPEAWTVLAEIAEQEERWNDSEEMFLRALYADPTNVRANYMYSEALLARGRTRDALHHALEAYRYEPASDVVSWRVALAADYAGDADIAIEHARIAGELLGKMHPWYSDIMAFAYLRKGDTDRALQIWAELGNRIADWYPACVRSRESQEKRSDILEAVRATLEKYRRGEADMAQSWFWPPNIMNCAAWLGEPDLVFEVMDVRGVPPFEDGAPTEVRFMMMFPPDFGAVRQHPRFRQLVLESGLLEYWKKWGWADRCEPDGDSFRCD